MGVHKSSGIVARASVWVTGSPCRTSYTSMHANQRAAEASVFYMDRGISPGHGRCLEGYERGGRHRRASLHRHVAAHGITSKRCNVRTDSFAKLAGSLLLWRQRARAFLALHELGGERADLGRLR